MLFVARLLNERGWLGGAQVREGEEEGEENNSSAAGAKPPAFEAAAAEQRRRGDALGVAEERIAATQSAWRALVEPAAHVDISAAAAAATPADSERGAGVFSALAAPCVVQRLTSALGDANCSAREVPSQATRGVDVVASRRMSPSMTDAGWCVRGRQGRDGEARG
jgi:hypothetical protein